MYVEECRHNRDRTETVCTSRYSDIVATSASASMCGALRSDTDVNDLGDRGTAEGGA
jgi:hypothetical protein